MHHELGLCAICNEKFEFEAPTILAVAIISISVVLNSYFYQSSDSITYVGRRHGKSFCHFVLEEKTDGNAPSEPGLFVCF